MVKKKNHVRLTTYTLLPQKTDVNALKTLEAPSILVPEGVVAPESSIVTLFGFKYANLALAPVTQDARKKKQTLAIIELSVLAENPDTVVLTWERTKQSMLINFPVAKNNFLPIINEEFRKREGISFDVFEAGNIKAKATRLDMIEKLFSWPEFEHASIIVVNVESEEVLSGFYSVAILNQAKYIQEKQFLGKPDVEITLPSYLK